MVSFIYYIVNMTVVVYGIYYIITGLFALINNKGKIRNYAPSHKFAVLIAARNEEKVIGNLIDSLKKQDYPKELFDIYVITNNCTDNTAKVSLDSGARVLACDVEVSSKGDVLKWTFDKLKDNSLKYDAYCVFDADNVAHPKFLSKMNNALCEQFLVAQGYRDSKNPSDTWISSCYSLFYWTQNYFFNQARMNIGWSSSINGTGFMISTKYLKKYGFNPVTMTEDIELAAQCACNNVKIAFVKDAITYDEQPLGFMQSWRQRKRWSVGTLQCLRSYYKPLIKNGLKKDIPQCIDMLLFFMAPIMQILGFVLFIILAGYNIFNVHISGWIQTLFGYNILFGVGAYLLSVCLSTFVVFIENKSITKAYLGIFTILLFMLTWLPINVVCMFKKDIKWEPIEHDVSLNIDSIT